MGAIKGGFDEVDVEYLQFYIQRRHHEIYEMIDFCFPFRDENGNPGYRHNQRDIIYQVIIDYLYYLKKFVILNLPTGSGKSVIAYTVSLIISRLALLNRPMRGIHTISVKDLLEEFKNVELPEEVDFIQRYNNVITEGPLSLILTKTKQLQEQYIKDFKGIKKLFGIGNYPCNYTTSMNIEKLRFVNKKSYDKFKADRQNFKIFYKNEDCHWEFCVAAKNGECPYTVARTEFISSQVGVTNYSFIRHIYFKNNPLYRPILTVYDECHKIEDIILDSSTVSFNYKRLYSSIGLLYDSPKFQSVNTDCTAMLDLMDASYKAWQEWLNLGDTNSEQCELRYLLTYLSSYIGKFLNDFRNSYLEEVVTLKEVYDDFLKQNQERQADDFAKRNYLYELIKVQEMYDSLLGLGAILEANKSIFLVTDTDVDFDLSISFTPLDISEFIHHHMYNKWDTQYNLLMSATILNGEYYAKLLKLDPKDYHFIDMHSKFESFRHPINVIPVVFMNHRNKEDAMVKIAEAVTWICNRHSNQSGIIHTVSYENSELLYELLCENPAFKNNFRLVLLEDAKEILEYLKTVPNAVILSPSITEGVDLKHDLSRFQITIKIPFANLANRWVSTKASMDWSWYSYKSILDMVQGLGRSIRDETDWCTSYILDANFTRLYADNKDLFPAFLNFTEIPFIEMSNSLLEEPPMPIEP